MSFKKWFLAGLGLVLGLFSAVLVITLFLLFLDFLI